MQHPPRSGSRGRELLLLLYCGCAPRSPLSEVPIDGGDEAQVAAARDALATFEAGIGAGRLQIVRVSFEPVELVGTDIQVGGAYTRGRILVNDTLGPGLVRDTVLHELCHALDDEEGLSKASDLFDALAVGPLAPTVSVRGGAHPRREAFALTCERGAMQADLLRSRCPGDPAGVDAVFGWLSEHVWTAGSTMPRMSTPPGAEASWQAEISPTAIHAQQEGHEPVITLQLTTDGWDTVSQQAVDLWNGAPAPLPWPRVPTTDLRAGPDVSATPRAHVDQITGWSAGPGGARLLLSVYGLGAFGRILSFDGVEWGVPAEVCPEDLSTGSLFAAEEAIWIAWAEGDTLRWREVVR